MGACWGDDLPSAKFGRLLAFGSTGSGKSTFGSTMPGPRFIIASDPNWAVPLKRDFAALPRAYVPEGETSRNPAGYYVVEAWNEVLDAVALLEREGAKHGVVSVIVDSLTSLSELCIYEILGGRPGRIAGTAKLTQQDWGTLFLRMDEVKHRLHQLQAHVLWLCGAKRQREGQGVMAGSREAPDLVGQAADRFPRDCQASLYVERTYVDGKPIARVRTHPDDEVIVKDNTGNLAPVEPADAYVILSKMGFLPPLSAAAIRNVVSPKPAKAAGKGGIL